MVSILVPTLADEFHSVDNVGWYGSVYLLVTGATQASMGKLYTIFSAKTVFLVCVALLEVGSMICALAQSSPTFIGGRAVAGLGCSGILSGALIITAKLVPLRQRASFTGIIGCIEGVAVVVGPVIGGAIADRIGWRWCFWINLPAGAALVLGLIFVFHPPKNESPRKTAAQNLRQVDFVGGLAIAGCITCLLLALEWGGTTYNWGNARIIGLLVAFGVSLVGIGVHQRLQGESATFPTRLLRNRSFVASLLSGFCMGSAQYTVLYYLPTWYQAVKGQSPVEAGVKMLPLVVAVIGVAISAGIAISFVGYLPPFVMAATVFASVGAGMLYTLTPSTSHARQVGYQILFGAGTGVGVQFAIVGAQGALDKVDVAYGTAAVLLVNTVGGAIFICAAQNVFLTEITALAGQLPVVDEKTLRSGFGSIRKLLSPGDLDIAIRGYNTGIQKVFLVVLVLACASALSWPLLSWKSVKQEPGHTTVDGAVGEAGKEEQQEQKRDTA
ncbi:aps11-like protein, partial [Metarhizium majus ARSEF 297]